MRTAQLQRALAHVEAQTIADELAGALRAVLSDCDRRDAMYGEASVRLSRQTRMRADAALKQAEKLA